MATSIPWGTVSLHILFVIIIWAPSNAASELPLRQLNDSQVMTNRFGQWMTRHGRQYDNKNESLYRFMIYQSNVQFIDNFNSQNYSFKLVDNKFADLTNKEFTDMYLRCKPSVPENAVHEFHENVTRKGLPGKVDWRDSGAVTEIKDQGRCGSCWAFTAVAAVEGITQIKTGKLISLSEQQLVDCDTAHDNKGCSGGLIEPAYEFIKQTGGLVAEKDYPYTGRDGACNNAQAAKKVATITGYVRVPHNDEKILEAATAKQPISTAMDARGYHFQFYSHGIYTGPCTSNVNHGITIVGYGKADDAKYWLVKNSWGENWGEEGYVKMKRGASDATGTCGIARMPSYPLKD